MVKQFLSWLHLWLGLIAGLVILFVSLTGTIIVYSDEIMDLSAGKARFVKEVKKDRLPVEELMKILKKEFPERRNPGYMVAYNNPQRSVRFNTFSKSEGLRMVYVDPYSGEILKDDATIYFFYITAHLHHSLLLGKTGKWIVDISAIIFLIELITGLVIWWPAKWTRKNREAAFLIKRRSSRKRLNYDLHNVLGFYVSGISLVLVITGLIIAFPSLSGLTVRTFGGSPSDEWEKSIPSLNKEKLRHGIDEAIVDAFDRFPDKPEIQVATYRIDKAAWYQMRVADRIGLKSARNVSFLVYDSYGGKILDVPGKIVRGEDVENMYWSLHMGTWMGPLGKLITFLGGLIVSSLPVTGIYIWWGKRRKNRKIIFE